MMVGTAPRRTLWHQAMLALREIRTLASVALKCRACGSPAQGDRSNWSCIRCGASGQE